MKTFNLSGVVGYDITAESIRQQGFNENSSEKIQVVVNSPGGFVVDAFEIYNMFKQYKGEVNFVINGLAASAMSYIIMSGDKISAFKNSIFMAHPVQAVAFGSADQIQREADIARMMDNVIAEAYSARMKKKKKEIVEDMKNEIWLIGWESLVDAGVIDDVIDSADEIQVDNEIVRGEIIHTTTEIEKRTAEENREMAALLVMQTQNKMIKDVDKIKTNSLKAAALLRQENRSEPVKTEDDKSKIQQEEKMNLQEFLNSNPDAKAEHEELLRSAEAKGIEGVESAVNAERSRIIAVLNKSDTVISETVLEALENGLTAEQYASAELDRQKQIRQNASKPSFMSLAVKQTPAEQDTIQAAKKALSDEELKKRAEALAEKLEKEKGGI